MCTGWWRTAVASEMASWNHGKIQPRSGGRESAAVLARSQSSSGRGDRGGASPSVRIVMVVAVAVAMLVFPPPPPTASTFGTGHEAQVRVVTPTGKMHDRRPQSVRERGAPDVVRDACIFVVPHPPGR